jgi:hypothetical protein
MQWHELIFSENTKIKMVRHLVFWLAWWIYYCFCFSLLQSVSFPTINPVFVSVGSFIIVKSFFLIAIYAVACYFFIYTILPILKAGKYFSFFAATLLLLNVLVFACHFEYWYLFPYINQVLGEPRPAKFPTWYWPAINLGLVNSIKVLTIAGTIKYMKNGWIKEQESSILLKEKSRNEIQTLRAQINPGFLTGTLNYVHTMASVASMQASQILLKLSDLLSYMLYECDAQTVPLSREVEMMREYMMIEKMKLGESFELELNINDDLNNLSISPFLLLPFIENGFQLSSRHCDSAWMNMDLSVNGNIFQMTLTHGLYPDDNQIDTPPDIILNVQKRLKLLFQNRYELKMYTQEEMMIVQLKLQLDECKVTDQNQQYFSSISTFDL